MALIPPIWQQRALEGGRREKIAPVLYAQWTFIVRKFLYIFPQGCRKIPVEMHIYVGEKWRGINSTESISLLCAPCYWRVVCIKRWVCRTAHCCARARNWRLRAREHYHRVPTRQSKVCGEKKNVATHGVDWWMLRGCVIDGGAAIAHTFSILRAATQHRRHRDTK